MDLYDIKCTRAERKVTSEQMWIGETPGALNGQETMDKVGSDNRLAACRIKSAFLHLCCLLVAGFGNLSANISGTKLKKLLNLLERVDLLPPILLQISYHSYVWPNNCQTP